MLRERGRESASAPLTLIQRESEEAIDRTEQPAEFVFNQLSAHMISADIIKGKLQNNEDELQASSSSI